MSERVPAEGLFDRAASSYGTVGPDHFGHFADLLVDRIGVAAGADVLDVATGTGAVIAAVARKGAGERLVAVDKSTGMLARARRRLRELDVDLVEMDAQRLRFPRASFDTVLCSFGLQSFDNPEAALLGMSRVLRPGGRLGLVYPRAWHFLCDEGWRWQVDVFHRYGVDVDMSETEPADLALPLEETGFEAIHVDAAEYRLVFRTEAEWWSWSWSHGTRTLFEAVPGERLQALRHELARGMRARCLNGAGSVNGSLQAFIVSAKTPN